jgi:Putative DNA-binding domain
MRDLAAFQDMFGAALTKCTTLSDPALARALTIHRNTSTRAAQTALADNFPVVRAMVGEEAFDAVAHDFVAFAPPAEPRLCLYGVGFSAFLDYYPPFADYRYLADIAEVERLVVEALFAADATPRDAHSFATLNLATPLRLHPAVRFATLATPAGSLWLAHQDDAPEDALDTIVWQPECVLITRPGNRIAVAAETPAATAFIEACADGLPLGKAAAAAGDTLADVFARTISNGCFA